MPTTATVRAFGPGRVNLIGEHTDYNDGLCLPFAIGRGITVEARPRHSGISARAVDLGEEDTFALGEIEPADGWRAFVRGTAAELIDAGYDLRPAELIISGDLPRGCGLSSSAALEVAVALALLAHGGHREPDRTWLATLCSRVENMWVGAQTGLLDQLAALHGEPGHALRLDMRSLEIEPIPLPLGGWQLVTVDSGSAHAHGTSGYNDRRAECRRACALLGIASLRDADPAAAGTLPAPLDRRVRHVIAENRRVDDTVTALRTGDIPAVARLVDASHASLRDDFAVSVPAVERTVAALKAAGAAGARIVGGGFGGSVLALFPPGVPRPAGTVEVSSGPAARVVEAS